MPKSTSFEFDDLVNYIITPPCHNITEAADHFDVSNCTVSKYLKRLSTVGDEHFDLIKAQLVNETLERLLSESRANSGRKSHRPFTFTTAEALKARYMNVYLGVSTREIGKMYRCSHMTVYNAIKALDAKTIQAQDEEVKRMMDEKNKHLQDMGDLGYKWKR